MQDPPPPPPEACPTPCGTCGAPVPAASAILHAAACARRSRSRPRLGAASGGSRGSDGTAPPSDDPAAAADVGGPSAAAAAALTATASAASSAATAEKTAVRPSGGAACTTDAAVEAAWGGGGTAAVGGRGSDGLAVGTESAGAAGAQRVVAARVTDGGRGGPRQWRVPSAPPLPPGVVDVDALPDVDDVSNVDTLPDAVTPVDVPHHPDGGFSPPFAGGAAGAPTAECTWCRAPTALAALDDHEAACGDVSSVCEWCLRRVRRKALRRHLTGGCDPAWAVDNVRVGIDDVADAEEVGVPPPEGEPTLAEAPPPSSPPAGGMSGGGEVDVLLPPPAPAPADAAVRYRRSVGGGHRGRLGGGGAGPAAAAEAGGSGSAATFIDTPANEWGPLMIGVASVATAVAASYIFRRR